MELNNIVWCIDSKKKNIELDLAVGDFLKSVMKKGDVRIYPFSVIYKIDLKFYRLVNEDVEQIKDESKQYVKEVAGRSGIQIPDEQIYSELSSKNTKNAISKIILEHAKDLSADAIIIGPHNRYVESTLFEKSLSNKIVEGSTYPVMILHN